MISAGTLIRAFAVAACASVLTLDAQACAACFGQSDSAMARGMNMGIFTLLLVITCVLFSVAGFFVYLIRRGSQLAEAHEQGAIHLSETQSNA